MDSRLRFSDKQKPRVFSKRISIRKNGKRQTSWALVKLVGRRVTTTPNGFLSRAIANRRKKAGWARLARQLRRGRPVQAELFGGGVRSDPVPEKVEMRVCNARIERTCGFGNVWLGWLPWQTWELDRLQERELERGRELTCSCQRRACFNARGL